MAFHAVFELCMQFTSFRNVDLLHQGTYRIESQVYVHPETEILYPTEAEPEGSSVSSAAAPASASAASLSQQPSKQQQEPGVSTSSVPTRGVSGIGAERNGSVAVLQGPPSFVLHNVAAQWGESAVAAVPCVHFASAASTASGKAGRCSAGVGTLGGGPPRGPLGGPLLCPGEGDIHPERNAFASKPFYIKYSDEQVDLSQVVTYRLEMPFASLAALQSAACVLQLLLLYTPGSPAAAASGSAAKADCCTYSSSEMEVSEAARRSQQQHRQQVHRALAEGSTESEKIVGQSDEKASASADQHITNKSQPPQRQKPPGNEEKKARANYPTAIAGRWLLLRNLFKGIFSYIPVVFEGSSSSLLEAVVCACLLDVKMRLRPELPAADGGSLSALLAPQKTLAERAYATAVQRTRAVNAAATRAAAAADPAAGVQEEEEGRLEDCLGDRSLRGGCCLLHSIRGGIAAVLRLRMAHRIYTSLLDSTMEPGSGSAARSANRSEEDWRKALNLLDSRLLDVVDNKL
ncbi:hypothetical protein cyc_08277 [Cyclospora cayetanensis]|uniref:Uncharacterized protein n=1 Tax=Cyclospora cayetanensis TaxID=88456 RepID=A0A1D3D639_9EIME|nr:hypothetical protein cyc_08277 [Cyclospora cayetanensis]